MCFYMVTETSQTCEAPVAVSETSGHWTSTEAAAPTSSLAPISLFPHGEMTGTVNCMIISKFKKRTSAEQCQ